MQEILKEIKDPKFKEMGFVPNLWGASPVGRDVGDRSYQARAVDKGGPDQAMS